MLVEDVQFENMIYSHNQMYSQTVPVETNLPTDTYFRSSYYLEIYFPGNFVENRKIIFPMALQNAPCLALVIDRQISCWLSKIVL